MIHEDDSCISYLYYLSTIKPYYLREVPGAFTPPVDDDAVELQRYTTDEGYNNPVMIGEFSISFSG